MTSNNITTVRNSGNMSRLEIVAWVNSRVDECTQIAKVEDLCSGVAYCRLMETMAPKTINMSQVDMSPLGVSAFERNLGVLQDAFNVLKIKKSVPIDFLVQGRFKHNLEFFNYFKKLYDALTRSPGAIPDSRFAKPIKGKVMAVVKPIKKETTREPEEDGDGDGPHN